MNDQWPPLSLRCRHILQLPINYAGVSSATHLERGMKNGALSVLVQPRFETTATRSRSPHRGRFEPARSARWIQSADIDEKPFTY